MRELKKVRGMKETHQLHVWEMVYCGSSWTLRTYDVTSSWTVVQERGGMRTTRIIACPKRKKMLYERQCKCVVLVLSEKQTHEQLTTVTPHPHGLHWGLQKKNLSVVTTERFHAKKEQQGTFKDLQLLCGTGRNAKEEP